MTIFCRQDCPVTSRKQTPNFFLLFLSLSSMKSKQAGPKEKNKKQVEEERKKRGLPSFVHEPHGKTISAKVNNRKTTSGAHALSQLKRKKKQKKRNEKTKEKCRLEFRF